MVCQLFFSREKEKIVSFGELRYIFYFHHLFNGNRDDEHCEIRVKNNLQTSCKTQQFIRDYEVHIIFNATCELSLNFSRFYDVEMILKSFLQQ